ALLCAAYDEEPDKEGVRVVLRLRPEIAPYKVAVLPLSKNERLSPLAREVWDLVRPHWMSTYDETQAIGRRYRRQDEIGTPLCAGRGSSSPSSRRISCSSRSRSRSGGSLPRWGWARSSLRRRRRSSPLRRSRARSGDGPRRRPR